MLTAVRPLSAVILSCVALVACGPTPTGSPEPPALSAAMPLAFHRADGVMEARNVGRIQITDGCTFLVGDDGERELLAWPADRTAWVAATSSIAFRRLSGELVTLQDGDRVVLGGGGSSLREDRLTGMQWAAKLDWVVPPRPECLIDVRWEVGDVQAPR